MTCRHFEPLVALWIEGDLQGSECLEIETHLHTCDACRALAADLRESQVLFKSIRQDVPNRAMLLNVRERVCAATAGREPGGWLERVFSGGFVRKATLAAIVLMLAGSGAFWLARQPRIPPAGQSHVAAVHTPPVEEHVAASTEAVAPELAVSPPLNNVQRRKPAPKQPEAAKPESQVTIKLLTDDPKVIIYWIVDSKGD